MVCCSGHLLPSLALANVAESKKEIPMFVYHGVMDPVIPIVKAKIGYDALTEAGFTLDFTSEGSLGHSLSGTELTKMKEFFDKNMV